MNAQACLTHHQTVSELNRVAADICAARAQCHRALRTALAGAVAGDTIERTLAEVDGFAATLEGHFNTLFQLKFLHPAAWEASEAGVYARVLEAAIDRVVAESMALVFGMGGGSATNEEQSDPAGASGDSAFPDGATQ